MARRFSSSDGIGSPQSSSGSTAAAVAPQARDRTRTRQSKIHDDPAVIQGYESVPLIEIDALPRGGISFETSAVGRMQVCTFVSLWKTTQHFTTTHLNLIFAPVFILY